MSEDRSRRLSPLAGLAWALAGAASCAAMTLLEPNLLEEGFILDAAQRLLRGDRLYRDIVTFTGPFPYELLALLFRLLGEENAAGRAAVVVLHGVATASVLGLARRAGLGALAHAAAAVVAAAPVLGFPLFSLFFYTTMVFHLSLIAAYAAVRGTGSAGWALAAGALAALAALTKQNVGGLLAGGLLLCVAAGAPPGRRLRQAAALAAGGALVAAITLIVFGVRGDLEVLVRSLVFLPLSFVETFNSPYMNFWPLGELSPTVSESKAFYFPYFYALIYGIFAEPGSSLIVAGQLLYGLPFIALIATGVRLALRRLSTATWVNAAVLVALIANLFPRTDWGHLVFVLPSALVQLLLLAPERRGGDRWLRPRVWASVAMVVVLVTGSVFVGRWLHRVSGPPTFGPRVPLRPVAEAYRGRAIPRVIRYLRARVRPGEAIFVARAEPLIYFATDTRNPTPYGGVIPGMREEQERTILAAFETLRYVVMSEIDQPVYTYYGDELPAVQDHLERFYHIPRAFSRQTDSWILVLERGRDRGPTAIDLVRSREEGRAWTRGADGVERPEPATPPRLAGRHNRRPLPVILGARGGGIDFEIEVPPDAVFQGDVGRWQMTGLRNVYQHPKRARLVVSIGSGGQFEEIASARVLAGGHRGREWTSIEADLSAYAGERRTVRLELIPERPLRPGTLTWWGSPRIALRPPD